MCNIVPLCVYSFSDEGKNEAIPLVADLFLPL